MSTTVMALSRNGVNLKLNEKGRNLKRIITIIEKIRSHKYEDDIYSVITKESQGVNQETQK
jgi:hypothetical protein